MSVKNLPTDVRTFRRVLAQLFPHENPLSAAMWRLAIIRDDLQHELHHTAAPADREHIWETSYYLRRLSVSVLEAKNIFDREIATAIKARKRRPSPEFVRRIEVALTDVTAAGPLLKPIRDSLGGHVRPNHANPDRTAESYETRGLRTHADWPGEIAVDILHSVATSYREFTMMSYLFAWPEVTNGDKLMEKVDAFQKPVLRAAVTTLKAIDGILCAFWQDIGTVAPVELGPIAKPLVFK